MSCIEKWKSISEYEGIYAVSDHGHVRSLDRTVNGPYGSKCVRLGKILKASPNNRVYCTVILTNSAGKKTSRPVHLLVLETFVGPRPAGLMGCHGPEGQTVNGVWNLRWDTQSSNVLDQLRYGTHRSGATIDTCGKGHPYTPENTYWTRKCRKCNRRKTGGQDPPAHLHRNNAAATATV